MDLDMPSSNLPFGNPDGARSDIQDMLHDFIEFDSTRYGGIGLSSDDKSVRVIVGTKGSGKTVYLRRLQDAASRNSSVYADLIQQEVPQTATIVKFCQACQTHDLTEMWERLWYCAILVSLVSHLLYKETLRDRIDADKREILLDLVPEPFPFKTPISSYSGLTSIINYFNTLNSFQRYFNDSKWPQLEYHLGNILKDLPPIYFFIDSIDEEYGHAPLYWLKCQEGLFYRTMRFLRDAQLGGRLHVIICIRDHALASVFRTENRERYLGEPHIRILNWNYKAIRFFMEIKLERMSEDYFPSGKFNSKNLLHSWLGQSQVTNLARHTTESIDTYLIRHTRLSPRDIVNIGNELAKESLHARKQGLNYVDEAKIRRVVSDMARGFAYEQIAICANQLTSNSMPPIASRKNFSDYYTGDNEYVRSFADKLKQLIKSIDTDKFSWETLQTKQDLAKEIFGEHSDPFSVLWQNRLLGYRNGTTREPWTRFFSERFLDDFKLPENKTEYIFHPCLIDGVEIKSDESTPPLPWENET